MATLNVAVRATPVLMSEEATLGVVRHTTLCSIFGDTAFLCEDHFKSDFAHWFMDFFCSRLLTVCIRLSRNCCRFSQTSKTGSHLSATV